MKQFILLRLSEGTHDCSVMWSSNTHYCSFGSWRNWAGTQAPSSRSRTPDPANLPSAPSRCDYEFSVAGLGGHDSCPIKASSHLNEFRKGIRRSHNVFKEKPVTPHKAAALAE